MNSILYFAVIIALYFSSLIFSFHNYFAVFLRLNFVKFFSYSLIRSLFSFYRFFPFSFRFLTVLSYINSLLSIFRFFLFFPFFKISDFQFQFNILISISHIFYKLIINGHSLWLKDS